jgi:hypothetical protein
MVTLYTQDDCRTQMEQLQKHSGLAPRLSVKSGKKNKKGQLAAAQPKGLKQYKWKHIRNV